MNVYEAILRNIWFIFSLNRVVKVVFQTSRWQFVDVIRILFYYLFQSKHCDLQALEKY